MLLFTSLIFQRNEGISVHVDLIGKPPLTNRKPADPTTMLSAMVEGQRLTSAMGQDFTVFTADQQLYKIMVDIIWVYPSLFKDFEPRLGGMHVS